MDDYGRQVASVRLMIDGRETVDPALLRVVETRAGRPLSMLEVRESLTHLFSLGRFDNVSVDASMEAGGVLLRYDLSPVHVISKIEFAGNLGGIDAGQLRRAVTDRYGTSPPLNRVDELSRVITDVMTERGTAMRWSARADIDRGSRMRRSCSRSSLAGTLIGPDRDCRDASVSREELLKRLDLVPGEPFQPDALARRIARYVEGRRKVGYYEAQVTPSVRLSDDDRVANLTLAVPRRPHPPRLRRRCPPVGPPRRVRARGSGRIGG